MSYFPNAERGPNSRTKGSYLLDALLATFRENSSTKVMQLISPSSEQGRKAANSLPKMNARSTRRKLGPQGFNLKPNPYRCQNSL